MKCFAGKKQQQDLLFTFFSLLVRTLRSEYRVSLNMEPVEQRGLLGALLMGPTGQLGGAQLELRPFDQ